MTRMTDDGGRTKSIEAVLRAHGFASRDATTDELVAAALGELDRARSEEARLLKENAEKDARIEALADALGALKRVAPTTAEVEAVLDDVDAALRLAGRLP